MRVADYRDKEWDARYEQFKIARERRKRAELQSVSNNPGSNTSAPTFKPRVKINAKPELRAPANHSQSRFLRTHSTNQPVQNFQGDKPAPTHVQIDNTTHSHHSHQSEFVGIENIEVEKRKFNLIEILPYIFIALGVVIIVIKVV